jgi:CHASE1-domain containing sensor protein
MVTASFITGQSWALLAADPSQPLLQRLDPERRAGVLLALAGLVLLALILMVLTYLGARYVKRIARHRPMPRQRDPSDWDRLPKKDRSNPA